MKNKTVTHLVALLFFFNTVGMSLAEDLLTATATRLRNDLSFLAADALEGRDVGSEGIARAGEFVAERFQQLGLETEIFDGSPYQEFSIPGPAEMGPAEKNTLAFDGIDLGIELKLGTNFQPLALGSNGAFEAEVVFAGYGITAPDLNYDDYADVDVAGKVVIILRKEPQQADDESVFDGRRSSQYAFFSSKELNASLHKAAALLMINDSSTVASGGDKLLSVRAAGRALSDAQVPTFYCTRNVIEPMIQKAMGKSISEIEAEIDTDLKPQSQLLEGIVCRGQALVEQSKIAARNVLGLLPGAGDLADEYVVVGAHYDHVGMGGQGSLAPGTIAIHNGADDNASGTTAMLEVAKRMADDQSENRRTLIFMAFTGEEKGLLGSKHYVRNPRWPLEDTVAMVNMDMVGRLNENTLTVYGVGTAHSFDSMMDRLNEAAQFNLDKREAGFGPSDHSSFYEAKIPVFHFFTGLHNDYHRPSDDIEKVNYSGMARIANLVTDVVSELALAEQRPEYIQTKARANVGRKARPNRPRAILGIELDLESDVVRVAKVSPGPSADAGLQSGDVILSLGGTETKDVATLRAELAKKKPGDTVSLVLQRGDQQVEVEVRLGRG